MRLTFAILSFWLHYLYKYLFFSKTVQTQHKCPIVQVHIKWVEVKDIT